MSCVLFAVSLFTQKHVQSTIVLIYQFLQQLKHKFTFLKVQINPLLSFLCLTCFFLSLLVHLLPLEVQFHLFKFQFFLT